MDEGSVDACLAYTRVYVDTPVGRLGAWEHRESGSGTSPGVVSMDLSDRINSRYDYLYDGAGRIRWESASGRIVERLYSTSDASNYSGFATRYTYDANGALAAATSYLGTATDHDSTPIPGRDFHYTYDRAGNRTARTVGSGGDSQLVQTATANNFNQLATIESPTKRLVTAYSWNSTSPQLPAERRGYANGTGGHALLQAHGEDFRYATIHSGNLYGPLFEDWTEVAFIDRDWNDPEDQGQARAVQREHLTPARTQALTYDSAGNLTHDGLWRYYWNVENRLVRMERDDTAHEDVDTQGLYLAFEYDSDGRRIRKAVYDRGALTTDLRFIYDGWDLIAEIDARTVDPDSGAGLTPGFLRRHFWTPGGIGGAGRLLCQMDGADDPGPEEVHYAGYDGKGHLTTLGSGDDAELSWYSEYSPFGEPLVPIRLSPVTDESLPPVQTPFAFHGEYRDEETGLSYFGYRYYSASQGRFISRDPLGEVAGANLYHYAFNDPVNRRDLLGLCVEDDNSGEDPNGFFGQFWKSIGNAVQAIGNVVVEAVQIVGNVVTAIGTGIELVGDAITVGGDFVSGFGDWITDNIPIIGPIIGAPLRFVGGAISGTGRAISSIGRGVKGVGQLLQGDPSGIRSYWDSLVNPIERDAEDRNRKEENGCIRTGDPTLKGNPATLLADMIQDNPITPNGPFAAVPLGSFANNRVAFQAIQWQVPSGANGAILQGIVLELNRTDGTSGIHEQTEAWRVENGKVMSGSSGAGIDVFLVTEGIQNFESYSVTANAVYIEGFDLSTWQAIPEFPSDELPAQLFLVDEVFSGDGVSRRFEVERGANGFDIKDCQVDNPEYKR